MILSTSLHRLAVTGCLLFSLHGIASAVVQIETVVIGQTGNPADPNDPTMGSVSYEYRIATYETSIADYCEFLNATAQSDPHGLYNPNMGTDLNVAGIARSGSSGSYSYSVIGNGDRPIAYVNWFDAARFSNWMHNGQGTGSTETGVYTLTGADTGTVIKNPGATVWLPTDNEWYKAAYYDPATGGFYHEYPTRNGNAPGNEIGTSANQANYYENDFSTTPGNGFYTASQNYLTPGGAFSGSASYFGTFDQAGNVGELVDPEVDDTLFGTARGGDWNTGNLPMLKAGGLFNLVALSSESADNGFRLAFAVPEPSHAMLGAAGLGLLSLRRRRDRV